MTDTDTEQLPPLIDFDNVTTTPDSSFLDESSNEPDVEFTQTYDDPDASFLTEQRRSPKSVKYEKKTASWFNGLFRASLSNPDTLPDAAAISMHAQPVSRAIGDLAAVDPRVERAIDFVSTGTNNPYAAVVFATMPLVLQLIRNRDIPILKPIEIKIKLPFGKRKGEVWRKFVLDPRNFTNDPDALAEYVFNNPDMIAALEKRGLRVPTATPRG